MGVMACDRQGCDNIMCTRTIRGSRHYTGSYYICDDCFRELVALKGTWRGPLAESEIVEKIAEFMETERQGGTADDIDGRDGIDEIFRHLTDDGDGN
jgi:tRNA G26 N,N-dimethylase Trm1